jgi:DNA-binding PadR family transcriptional regulator
VSLRSAIVAALLLGDQYGLQLHGEIVVRTARTVPLNVGQVYATLERLVASGLVTEAGATRDGLRLYRLAPTGRRAADDWLRTPASPVDWTSMREQVLLASTIPDRSTEALVTEYGREWAAALATPSTADLGADAALATAALEWLGSLGDLSHRRRPLDEVRPRRGRRPAA